MPRASTRPEIMLALSQSATARALGIRPERVRDAIDAGELIVRQLGAKRRIAVFGEGGIQKWFESWPRHNERSPNECFHVERRF
jgi:hypothetical protein